MTSFFKLSGAGNDFIALVEPEEAPLARHFQAWCRRALSVGADGLLLLHRTSDGARLIHFNADGGRSDLCLNSSRCAAQLAFHLGWGQGDRLALKTDAGMLQARRLDEHNVETELPVDLPGEPVERTLKVGAENHLGWHLKVGVPHFVLPWDTSLAEAPIDELGATLRSHPDLGEEGANINFVRFVEREGFEIRTFERGVEGETLACGTGVVATVQAGLTQKVRGQHAGFLSLPARALTTGGFVLTVDGRLTVDSDAGNGSWQRLAITGDARLIAQGEFLPGASVLPKAPQWS